jgi:hypothetical protein
MGFGQSIKNDGGVPQKYAQQIRVGFQPYLKESISRFLDSHPQRPQEWNRNVSGSV